MRSIRMWLGVLAAIWLAGTAQAWQPAGWVYINWPWAYDSTSGDWNWFSAGGTQWINAFPPGGGWSLMQSSSLAHGWSYWNGAWAYDTDTGAWCWRNPGGTQWVVNMRTEAWSRFGEPQAPDSVVSSFAIADGATSTTSLTVALNNTCTGGPTEYMASESASFVGASWLPYATAPIFTLSAGNGIKTVYFKVRNVTGTSGVLSDTITLEEGDPEMYLVMDLSDGPDAASYPVSYLGAMPSGGWTDAYKTTKLVLRRIPADAFTMGSPSSELGRNSDESQHAVTLTKGFYIGVFEVTQRQWELVMGNKPSYFAHVTSYATRPVEMVSYNDIRGNSAGSGWPANNNVDASAFMGKLRMKTELATLDLPTESQWEYACRAGMTTALNSGKNLTGTDSCPNVSEVGRYWHNGGSAYGPDCEPSAGTALVGSYLPNNWGLYDMHGNVYEWCLDWSATYPGTVTDPTGAASGDLRVSRGGGWNEQARCCRAAIRYYNDGWPSYQNGIVGLRVARTLP